MSIFASRTTQTIPVPFDPPHEVTIQKLNGRHLEKAREENQFASIDAYRRMGGAAFQKELEDLGDPDKRSKAITDAQADPLNAYDEYVLLAHGIKAWTYDIPVTAENVEDLDGDAVTFLAREILKLSKPSLFKTTEEVEADRKNG